MELRKFADVVLMANVLHDFNNPVAALKNARLMLKRGGRMLAEGKPYLIDAQVARRGVGWVAKPWTIQLDHVAELPHGKA